MMTSFKNFLYGYDSAPMYGQVYHDKKQRRCVFADGRFMILSKELFDENKDLEILRKNKRKASTFDYHNFDYCRCLSAETEYAMADFESFKTQCRIIDGCLFDKTVKYEDCEQKIFFKDFGVRLSLPIVHTVFEFISENSERPLRFYVNKNDKLKNMKIEAYDYCDEMFSDKLTLVNSLYFMPMYYGECTHVMEKNELKNEIFDFKKNILYSYGDMANVLSEHGIPHTVIAKLADPFLASILDRPIFSLTKFDEYLHQKYGDYENEGKSMQDIFVQIFGNDIEKIKYFFGVDSNK